MPEDAQDIPDQVPPICPTALPNLRQRHDRSVHLPILVVSPRFILDRRLPVRQDALTLLRHARGRWQTGKDEDRLDSQLLERAEVLFDTSNESESCTASGCDEWFAGLGLSQESLDIMSSIDTEPRVAQCVERASLRELALADVRWDQLNKGGEGLAHGQARVYPCCDIVLAWQTIEMKGSAGVEGRDHRASRAASRRPVLGPV
jgi:hypothetical protein